MRLLLTRLVQLVPVVLGVSLITFLLVDLLPGDPAVAVLGENATPESLAALRSELGLDEPLLVRFWDYLVGAIQGDLGTSLRSGQEVTAAIIDRLPATLEILVLAQIFALGLAVPTALVAVRRRGTVWERVLGVAAFAGFSIPSFLLALVLILVLSVQLDLLPAVGYAPLSEGLGENLRTVLLPALSVAVAEYAVYFRVLQSDMLNTLQEDYVTTADSKGISVRRIFYRHVLRNSLLSLVTIIGLNVGRLLGGAVIVETIFAIPGIGRLLIDSIYQRDLVMVQGVVLFIAVAYVLTNLVVDLCYAQLDPRIRHEHAKS